MKSCLIIVFLVLTNIAYSTLNKPIESQDIYKREKIESLRDSLLKKGDYKRVIEYNDSLIKKEEELNRNAIMELELKAKAEAKEFEYKQLKENKEYNENRNTLLLAIFILLCSGSAIFVLYISSRKTNIKRRTSLIDAEKEEAKLKLKLKEEQTVKLELQKYEVLSEFNLKEVELNGKMKDFEQLRKEKEMLDKKVEDYRQSIEAFELLTEKSFGENNELQKKIIEEITPQIKKHLPGHEDYIKNIEYIKPSFIDTIMNVIDGNLSKQYLKYCICFAIGMSIKDVSDCCFIEQSSVHMIRYRLKKKIKLGNDDDIDLYLKKLSL